MTRNTLFALLASLFLVACGGSGGGDNVDAGGGTDTVQQDTAAPEDVPTGEDIPAGEDVPVAVDIPTLQDTSPPGDVPAPEDIPGPGPDGSTDVWGGGVDPGGWCTAWTQAWCELLARCEHPTQPVSDVEGCVAARVPYCLDADAVLAAADEGALAFDGQAADDCLALLADMSCDEFDARLVSESLFPDASCYDVLVGTVTAGEPCTLGSECVAGSRCVVDDTCPGACEAYVGLGGDCGVDALCDYDEALCADGVCQAIPDEAGEPCLLSFCKHPLVCDRTTDTCRAPGLVGDACSDATPCFTGLLCFGATGESGTCTPPRAEGESCFENADCYDLTATTTMVCAGGFCAVAPGAEEPCYEYLCHEAWCDWSEPTSPTCRALPTAGEACATGSRCAADAWCDAGTCRAKGAAGDSCTSLLECASSRCFAGVCVATGAPSCP